MGMLLLSALSFSTKAADFSFTVNWDNPGAVQIIQGGVSSPSLTIDADKTSWTGTEPDSYYVKPAPGYIILNVHEKYIKADTKQEIDRDKKLGGNEKYGQFCDISTRSLLNGAVYTITTKKLSDAGSFTLNVKNGADKFKAWFKNDKSGGSEEVFSTFSAIGFHKGEQEIKITDHDKYLNLSPLGSTKIFKVTLNGESQDLIWGGYEIPVKNGDNVIVQVFEQDPTACDVSIKFTNNENCLQDIYNRATGKFVKPDELAALNNRLSVDEGDVLQFNFNEDYTVSAIKVNGTPAENFSASGFSLTVTQDSQIEFTATAKIYPDVPVTLYLKNPEGIIIRKGPFNEDEVIDLGEGEELTSNVSFPNAGNLVIKAGEAKKYVFSVSGKRPQFFWSSKPGYWINEAVLCNSSDNASTWPSPGVMADQTPLYLAAKAVNTDNTLVFFFDGAEKEAKCFAENEAVSERLSFPGLGSENYIPVGYTISSFDPDYHKSISAGKVGGAQNKLIEIVVNGTKLKAADDGTFGFKLTADMDPAIVKVFSREAINVGGSMEVKNPVSELTVNFETTGSNTADITYDKIFRHEDPTKALKVIGKTLVSMKPAAGTLVIVDGNPVEPNADGLCEFWAEKRSHKVVFTDTSAVEEIETTETDPESKVYNLQGIEMKLDFDRLPAGIYIRNGKKIIKK